MKIIIIEDEELTANDLAATIVEVEPNAQILSVLKSIKEAVLFFERSDVVADLMFCDIQLGDGLSFEIFNKVKCNAPVIFCTAYDEYALQAFKTKSIDYILKPFCKKTISDALDKYKFLKNTFAEKDFNYNNILELFANKDNQNQGSLLVYYQDKILPIRYNDIALFYIETGVTYLITFDNREHVINKTLEKLEELTSANFFRTNRQTLLNRKAVKVVSQYFARKLSVSLTIANHQKIIISKEKSVVFLNWLSL